MNSSDTERFDELYRRIWVSLNRSGGTGVSHHEQQVLQHLTAEPVALSWLARHLGLPNSTTSVLVKNLAARGLVRRARDPGDERRLAITLTDQGRAVAQQDTVLEPAALARALGALDPAARAALLDGLARLAAAAESAGQATD